MFVCAPRRPRIVAHPLSHLTRARALFPLPDSTPWDANKVFGCVCDLGYRGVDKDLAPVEVIHRCKFKSLTPKHKTWLKRRQAIEPLIGHTKADHRMDRCWLKGAAGDALHAVLCAAGFNIRWLLRSIAKLGLTAILLALTAMALSRAAMSRAAPRPERRTAA